MVLARPTPQQGEVPMKLWCAVTALFAASGPARCASAAQAYEEAPVENGGTIKGKVAYTGRVPTRTILPTKDQQVCGQMREEPEVRVGPDGGVQDSRRLSGRGGAGQGVAGRGAGAGPRQQGLHLPAACPGDPRRHARRPQLRSHAAQHPRLLRPADRLQHRAAEPGPDHRRRPRTGRAGAHRVRCARLDARLGLRGRQPVLRGDRRGRHVRDHRRAARRVHPGRQPGIHRARGGRGHGRGGETVEVPVELQQP